MLKKLFLGVIFVCLLCTPNVFAANQVIDGNNISTFKRTKAQIQAEWQIGKLEIPDTIFTVEPSYTAPYRAGVVKQSYLDEVLDNLNYYRYLVGSPKITTKMSNRDDLQKAVVLQTLNLSDRENGIGLNHNLSPYPKPSDMSDDFYETAVYPDHNIISSSNYRTPVFPFFAESIFTYTAGHRNALLDPNVNQVSFGLGNVVYGDTDGPAPYHSNYYENMTNEFAAYPSPGYFPTQDFTLASDWDIYLNGNLYLGQTQEDKKNITATIENMTTHEITNYSLANGNLTIGARHSIISSEGQKEYGPVIHFKRPETSSYYEGDYKVTIKNIRKKTGELVDITYTVKFFDKFEGISSNVSSAYFNMYSLNWEDTYDANLVKKFLPNYSNIRLESGGFLKGSIKDYTLPKNTTSYGYTYYKAIPTYTNLPTYVQDANNVLKNNFISVVVANPENRQIKITSNKSNYTEGENVILTYSSSSTDDYIYSWYKLENNQFVPIQSDSKYTINGKTLTVKNATANDSLKYYIVAKIDPNMGASIVSEGYSVKVKNAPKVAYQTQVQQKGWSGTSLNGAVSGTVGSGLRMETLAINLKDQDVSGAIEYRSHVQRLGWETTWKKNGELSGTVGQGLRLEAIQIRLTGEMAANYDVYYRIHAQRFGWLDWAKNGESAGTSGFGFRVEAIQIVLVRKGAAAPGSTSRPYVNIDYTGVEYQTQVQQKGWLNNVSNGTTSGTVGEGLRMETLRIRLKNQGFSGAIEYRTHIQRQGWETTWKKNGENSGTVGQGLRLEALQLRLTGDMAKEYDIYYRVQAQRYGWLGWAKNGESAGTSGYGYRLEAIQIVLVRKGMVPPGSTANHFYRA